MPKLSGTALPSRGALRAIRCSLPPAHSDLPPSVVVASTNPVKVSAVRRAFARAFGVQAPVVIPVQAASGVSPQPIGDEETLQGARNRICSARAAKLTQPNTLLVSIEGGVGRRPVDGKMECFAWAVAEHGSTGAESVARSAAFVLPDVLTELVEDLGQELGHADAKVFGRASLGSGMGTVGQLSHGLLSRTEYCEQAVLLALLPFMNPDLYGQRYHIQGWISKCDLPPVDRQAGCGT
ncbi:inosine triphosphate pyrophosphatase-like protein [Haematococcus lacustris]